MTVITTRGFADDESRQRLQEQERRHISNTAVLRSSGYGEDHPAVAYHADLLSKVHTEMGRLGMQPREGRPATVEQGMESRAWKYLGKRDDDED